MKVVCVDVKSERSDRVGTGAPASHITAGKEYLVAEDLETQYSIVNDDFKIARYSKYRFKVVDDSPVEDLRKMFNALTTGSRTAIKQLEKDKRELRFHLKSLLEFTKSIHEPETHDGSTFLSVIEGVLADED